MAGKLKPWLALLICLGGGDWLSAQTNSTFQPTPGANSTPSAPVSMNSDPSVAGWTFPIAQPPPPPSTVPPNYAPYPALPPPARGTALQPYTPYPYPVAPPPPVMVPGPAGPVYPPPGVILPPAGRQVPKVYTEGPFASAELIVGYPVLDVSGKELPKLGRTVPDTFPNPDLKTYLSPTFEIGYRFATRGDYIAFSYRFIVVGGDNTWYLPKIGNLNTNNDFNYNQFDFDYGGVYSRSLSALWTLGTRVGIRVANMGFSTNTTLGGNFYEIQNNYWGAGPKGRLELDRKFSFFPDLSLYGRSDVALVLGQNNRKSTFTPSAPGPGVQAQTVSNSIGQGIPMLQVQAGLSYSPEDIPGFIFSGGYVYEHWWSVGQLNANGSSSFFNSGQIYSNGWFVRMQVDF
ncbi:MAG: hypothetical protein ACKO23_17155 [Gemmataceae bacterium]